MYSPIFSPIEELIGQWEKGFLYNFYGRTSSGKTTLSTYSPIVSISKKFDSDNFSDINGSILCYIDLINRLNG